MLIFFGRKASHIKSVLLPDTCCPTCDAQGSMVVSVFGKYAHIYWIPFFPIGKEGVAQCQSCKTVFKESQFNNEIGHHFYNLLQESRTPKRHWAGLGLIGGMIAIGGVNSMVSKSHNDKYLDSPKVGDRYEVRVDDEYSIIKVVDIKGDSVYCASNLYSSNRVSGIDKIDKPENYVDEKVPFTKSDLKIMFKEDKIIDVRGR